jgi:hypothetical protein
MRMTTSFSTLRIALAGTGLGLILALAAPTAFAADKEEGVRPDISKAIQAANDAMNAKNWDVALQSLDTAEAVKDKTPYEIYAIDLTRGKVASGKGDTALAAKSFAAALDTGKVKPDDQLKFMSVTVSLFNQSKDYANAAAWGQRYAKAGGNDPQVKTIVAQAEYLSGDNAAAARDLTAIIAAVEQSGQKPTEAQLQLLASAYLKGKDDAGYVSVLEKFVADYPNKDRWAELINRVERKPGFPDGLFLAANRLQRVTGSLTDYKGMVELDLQEGISSEAKAVADEGGSAVPKATQAKAAGAAAQDKAKIDRDAKDAEGFKDGNVLVTIGYTYVGFGNTAKGIELLQQGIAKGGLKHPDEAKLMLGAAYFQAGQMPKAIETFSTITNGSAGDLARLWVLRAKQG